MDFNQDGSHFTQSPPVLSQPHSNHSYVNVNSPTDQHVSSPDSKIPLDDIIFLANDALSSEIIQHKQSPSDFSSFSQPFSPSPSGFPLSPGFPLGLEIP